MHHRTTLCAALDLLSRTGGSPWCRLAKPAVKQADYDVGLVNKLPVDDGLRVTTPKLGDGIKLPSKGQKHDLLCTSPITVPTEDGCLDDIACVIRIARRGDQDGQDSCLEAHRMSSLRGDGSAGAVSSQRPQRYHATWAS